RAARERRRVLVCSAGEGRGMGMAFDDMHGWRSVTLRGDRHVMPRLCPNCLEPTERAYGLTYASGPRRYSETFYYCAECVALCGTYFSWKTARSGLWVFVVVPAGLAAAFVLAVTVAGSLPRNAPEIVKAVLFGVGLVGGIAFAWGLSWLLAF